MGKFKLPKGAIPPLNLSDEDIAALEREAEQIIQEQVEDDEAFTRNGNVFDQTKWKHVASKERLHAYKQRSSEYAAKKSYRKATKTLSASRSDPASSDMSLDRSFNYTSTDNSSIIAALKPAHIPMVACGGIVDGTMDDFLLGNLFTDESSWRMRAAYVKERFDDIQFLARLNSPREDDPFRFLAIKWMVKERPITVRAVSARRDYLVLEGTGTRKDSQGKRIGYHFMHSIQLSRVPDLSELNIIRGTISFCYTVRPLSDSTVQCYCRGWTDAKGQLMKGFVADVMAGILLTMVEVVEVGFVKKLVFFLRESRRAYGRADGDFSDHCKSCERRVNKFGSLLSGSMCQICREMVCTKCSVMKKVALEMDEEAQLEPMYFCLTCIVHARSIPSERIARSLMKAPKRMEQSSSNPGSGYSTDNPVAF